MTPLEAFTLKNVLIYVKTLLHSIVKINLYFCLAMKMKSLLNLLHLIYGSAKTYDYLQLQQLKNAK
jgi:hypothetical protein